MFYAFRHALCGRRWGRILLWMPQVWLQADRLVHEEPLPAPSAARARARWQRAFKQVRWLLKMRRLWAEIGHHLQDPALKSLSDGLERRRGVLRRAHAARL